MSDLEHHTQPGLPDTPQKILVCAYCASAIDDLEYGMLYWDVPLAETPSVRESVVRVELAHKKCRNAAERREKQPALMDYSAELWWMTAPELALRRLSSMADGYAFTGEQLQRIVDLVWALEMVGTDEQKAKARLLYEQFGMF